MRDETITIGKAEGTDKPPYTLSDSPYRTWYFETSEKLLRRISSQIIAGDYNQPQLILNNELPESESKLSKTLEIMFEGHNLAARYYEIEWRERLNPPNWVI